MEKQRPIDVVYVLGKGSHWRNNEIRFSLRALERNLKGFREVWVVGEKPEWIKNINHIPFKDELMWNADGNIARKVLRACQEEKLTEQFLFINDDHLIMKEIVASEIPPYHKGDMSGFSEDYFETDMWRERLQRTRDILKDKGYPAFHYDCHVPMIMDKNVFPEAIRQFDFEKNIGYTMKSLYGNVIYGTNAPKLNGEKCTVFKNFRKRDLLNHINGKTFVAFNDHGLTPDLKEWLFQTFPDPSKYEHECDKIDPFLEILNWLKDSERDFEEGCKLFDRYGKSRKVRKYLLKGPTVGRMCKLEHQLKELLKEV